MTSVFRNTSWWKWAAAAIVATVITAIVVLLLLKGCTNQPTAPAAPAGPVAVLQPTEQFCQLNVTQLTNGVPTHSLRWDSVQLRGYMDDRLATDIQKGAAYCKTVFPKKVKLLFDSIAANPVRVDGKVVTSGNGRIEEGTTFEWVYTGPAVSNGHAYIVQEP